MSDPISDPMSDHAPRARLAGATDEDPSLAVALAARHGRAASARVLAKGEGDWARQIVEIARDHGIPLQEDRDLAEILQALEPEESIPVGALAAVAEILSQLYLSRSEASDP